MSAETRQDPQVRRPLLGAAAFSQLLNRDPNKHYVIVSKIDRAAIATYEAMGYQYEKYTREGLRPRGVVPDQFEELVKKGKVIETLDGYVMSITEADRKQYIDAGRAHMDRIERMMAPRPGALPEGEMNPLSGMAEKDRRYFELERFTKSEGGLDHGDENPRRL